MGSLWFAGNGGLVHLYRRPFAGFEKDRRRITTGSTPGSSDVCQKPEVDAGRNCRSGSGLGD